MDLKTIKENLTFCPICGWRLDDDDTNPAVRLCVNHNAVFTVVSNGDGYRVEIDLAAPEIYE